MEAVRLHQESGGAPCGGVLRGFHLQREEDGEWVSCALRGGGKPQAGGGGRRFNYPRPFKYSLG